MHQKLRKYWKDIQEHGFTELLMVIATLIICILGYIFKLPPYTNLVAVMFIFIAAVMWRSDQAEKRESNEAIRTLKNRLEDFRKNFLYGSESYSFYSLSKITPNEDYSTKLWKKYHDCRFGRLELEVDYIDRQITGSSLNKQEISSCFRDLFNTTNRCYAFLKDYISEINEQDNLTPKHKEIVSVYNNFTDILLEDVRSSNIDVADIQLSKIKLSDLQ